MPGSLVTELRYALFVVLFCAIVLGLDLFVSRSAASGFCAGGALLAMGVMTFEMFGGRR